MTVEDRFREFLQIPDGAPADPKKSATKQLKDKLKLAGKDEAKRRAEIERTVLEGNIVALSGEATEVTVISRDEL